MRGRSNMNDTGRSRSKMRRETLDVMRYAEGAEGVIHGDARLVNCACDRFLAARGIQCQLFVPQAHFSTH